MSSKTRGEMNAETSVKSTDQRPRRVLSLIASSTEIVCALGLGDRLVGRSHECDYPEWVKRLPLVTEPKFDTRGTSAEIDARVKAIVSEGLSVYRVFPERLASLAPDVIVTQVQCEVCAVSLRDVEQAVCAVAGSKPRIVSLNPNRLEDIWADIGRVAEALGVVERGNALVAGLKARIEGLARRVAEIPRSERPRVAYLEWIEPLMTGGNWMPEVVELAGGVNLFGEAGKHSPFLNYEDLAAADPDVIFISPCGFDLERTRAEMPRLTCRPGWAGLKAVRKDRVFLGDGNQLFNRPGPRIVESIEGLALALHPGLGFELRPATGLGALIVPYRQS